MATQTAGSRGSFYLAQLLTFAFLSLTAGCERPESLVDATKTDAGSAQDAPSVIVPGTSEPTPSGATQGPKLTPSSVSGPIATRSPANTVHPALKGFSSRSQAVVSHILWQNLTSGLRGYWPISGVGYLGGWIDLGIISTSWEIAALADFTRDGHWDIVWQNTVTGLRGVWPMVGTTYVGGWLEIGMVPTEWDIAAAIDFNNDGDPDILWQNRNTGERGIWAMRNRVQISAWHSFGTVPVTWDIAGASDLTGDSKPDIVWQNLSNGTRGTWVMDGPNYTGNWYSVGIVPVQWRIAAVGEFSGDGRPDWLWHNMTSGDVGIWPMQGTAYQGGWSPLGTPALDWRIAAAGWHGAVLPVVSTFDSSNPSAQGVTLNGWITTFGTEATTWFEWGTRDDLSGYSTTAQSALTTGNFGAAVSAGIGPLSPSTTYYHRAVARNAAGTTKGFIFSFLSEAASNLPSPQLSSPLNGATGVSTTPTLIWNGVVGATSYRVMLATDPASLPRNYDADTCGACVVNTTTTSTSLPTPQLLAGTSYYWQVKGRNPTQFGDWSTIYSFVTSAPNVAAPTNFAAVATGPAEIRLTWTDNSTNESEYQVQSKLSSSGTWNPVTLLAANSITFVHSGLAASTTYDFRLRACNVETCSPYVTATASTHAGPVSGLSDGEHFTHNGTTYLVFNGRKFGYPLWYSFLACTRKNPGIAKVLTIDPGLPSGGTLPAIADTTPGSPGYDKFQWMGGYVPVRNPQTGGVFIVIGCVRHWVSWEIWAPLSGRFAIDGDPTEINLIPEGAPARELMRPAGALIYPLNNPSTVEVRWVAFGSGSIGVPTPSSLASQCRGVFTLVDRSEYDSYPIGNRVLHDGTTGCASAPPPLTPQPDFRLPLPAGKRWWLTVQAGGRVYDGGTDPFHATSTGYYSLDFNDVSAMNVSEPNVSVIASAGGRVVSVTRTCHPNEVDGVPTRIDTTCGGGFGNNVLIDHGNGFTTRYAHLRSVETDIVLGIDLARGRALGILGNSGNSFGTHLHFEIRYLNQGIPEKARLDDVMLDGRKLVEYRTGPASQWFTYYYSSNR